MAKAINLHKIKKHIEAKISDSEKIKQNQIIAQRSKLATFLERVPEGTKEPPAKGWIYTGIEGFDILLKKGVPKGSSNLICGGPGSGKTIFGLQTLYYGATRGEKCIYMSFEESEERLRQHMRDFGWDPEPLEKKGRLLIKRFDPFEVTRQVEAMLEKSKGELLIDVKPLVFPKGFTNPDRIVVDSASAIAAAFVGREDSYRAYIEHLFRLFEEIGSTSFLISETGQIPTSLTRSGVEEFLADGVILLYNIKRGNFRESAIEILKMRGADFKRQIVAMQIISGKGIVVYPEQEVFGKVEGPYGA